MSNKKTKKGFTLVEVMLFLAISGFLVMALIAGTSTTIARQRYNDSVQDYYSFLTKVYADVIHVENQQRGSSGGNTTEAIYGRLINFDGNGSISVYSVIGNANYSQNENDTLLALISTDAHIKNVSDYSYTPTFGARIQDTGGDFFQGRILIVRSPISGSVKTYYSVIKSAPCTSDDPLNTPDCKIEDTDSYSNDNSIDFCIQSDDAYAYSNKRRNIRIDSKNGFNSSAVKLINFDEGDSACD